jgi:hypothetical protein
LQTDEQIWVADRLGYLVMAAVGCIASCKGLRCLTDGFRQFYGLAPFHACTADFDPLLRVSAGELLFFDRFSVADEAGGCAISANISAFGNYVQVT